MTNLDSILKSRDITLPTKVRLVKAMVFPVVMYGCATVSIFSPSICHEVMGPDVMILVHRLLVQLKHTGRNNHSNLMKRLRRSVVTAIP